MIADKRGVIVKVPHRISGFFEIVDRKNGKKIINPEQIGSRGAGFNLSGIGRTKVILEELNYAEKSNCTIYINKECLNEKAETTFFIFNQVKKLLGYPIKVKIYHDFDLPVGCGYGASGSGALGAIYGLDLLLNLKLSDKEKGKIAHVAEVENRTGLGTVCGQLSGGLSMLKEPGYPCISERIDFPRDLLVICGTFGMIHTKSILTDTQLSSKIKQAGRIALKKLMKDPCINTFMKASIDFVRNTEILHILNLKKTEELMNDLNKQKIIGASMNQLGRSVYAVCEMKDKDEVLDIFNSYIMENKINLQNINKNRLKIKFL